VLQGYGFDPAPGDADIAEIVTACVHAINSLADRVSRFAEKQRVDSQLPPVLSIKPSVGVKSESPGPSIEADIKIASQRTELAECRKSMSAQKHEISSLEHQIRSRDGEIENLRSLLRSQARDEDKRGALTMTCLRERKIGTSAFILVNNLQRQIDNLERENESLKLKIGNITNRVRVRSPSRKNDEVNRKLCEEIIHLKQLILSKDTTIDSYETEIFKLKKREKGKKHLESVGVCTDEFRSEEGLLIDDLKALLFNENVTEAVSNLKLNEREIMFPLKQFVNELFQRFPGTLQGECHQRDNLDRLVEQIDKHLVGDESVQIATEAASILHCGRMELPSRLKMLLLENESLRADNFQDPVLNEAMKTLGVSAREKFVPVVRSIEFKLNEFSNFYRRLLALLTLSKGSTYAACMREIESRLNLPPGIVQSDRVNFDLEDSDNSDISVNNLAFVREVMPFSR
jgi:hypothetical protein